MKSKRFITILNHFETFTVASASNRYRILVNNMTAHDVVHTMLEYILKFINSLGKGWWNIKLYLYSNGYLKKPKLYQFIDELQGHESNVSQTLRQLSGGPLALVCSENHFFQTQILRIPLNLPIHSTCSTYSTHSKLSLWRKIWSSSLWFRTSFPTRVRNSLNLIRITMES